MKNKFKNTIPVNGRPVEVLGRDDAVFCPVLTAVAVLNDVPGFGAAAKISVSNGSSTKNSKQLLSFIQNKSEI